MNKQIQGPHGLVQTLADPPETARLLAAGRRTETAFGRADGPGRLVWHTWGEGPPVVLLHGGAGSWRHWLRAIPDLAAHSAVWVPDLPGLGESDAPPVSAGKPYGPTLVAGIVAAGLRQVLPGGAPCDLVGFSFGAMTAGHVAADHPDLVRSLVLVGAGALGVERASITLVPVRDKSGDERQEANRTNLLRLMVADPARIDAEALANQDWNARRARVNSIGFASGSLLLDALRRVRCPLGAIWGERDQVAAPRLAERVAAVRSVRPEAPVAIIPGAGHWVSHEAPAAFNAALDGMLGTLQARHAA